MDNRYQPLVQNAYDLEQELQWFARIIDVRFKLYFKQESNNINQSDIQSVDEIQPPDLSQSSSPYAQCIQHYALSTIERAALILALTPHLRPQLLDIFFTHNSTFYRIWGYHTNTLYALYPHTGNAMVYSGRQGFKHTLSASSLTRAKPYLIST